MVTGGKDYGSGSGRKSKQTSLVTLARRDGKGEGEEGGEGADGKGDGTKKRETRGNIATGWREGEAQSGLVDWLTDYLAATDVIGCHSEPRQAAITFQDSNPVRDHMRVEGVGKAPIDPRKKPRLFVHISYLSPNTSLTPELPPARCLWVRSCQPLEPVPLGPSETYTP
ncbi:hypothetical protein HOY80DRAFT_1003513 [Tuber brumale]|nr:hypothetical protein HOY80DRAFT_1003513 [Tuber brumale]